MLRNHEIYIQEVREESVKTPERELLYAVIARALDDIRFCVRIWESRKGYPSFIFKQYPDCHNLYTYAPIDSSGIHETDYVTAYDYFFKDFPSPYNFRENVEFLLDDDSSTSIEALHDSIITKAINYSVKHPILMRFLADRYKNYVSI